MSRKQDIQIVINPKGEVTFEVKGVKGGNCLSETKFLTEALGLELSAEDLRPCESEDAFHGFQV